MDIAGQQRRVEGIRRVWRGVTGLECDRFGERRAEHLSRVCRAAYPGKLKLSGWYDVLAEILVLYVDDCKEESVEPSFYRFCNCIYVYSKLWRHLKFPDHPVLVHIYGESDLVSSDDVVGFGSNAFEYAMD